MRAFVGADEAAAAHRAATILTAENFVCNTGGLDEGRVADVSLGDYDIVVLDLGAAEDAGCELTRRLRAAGVRTPILIIAAAADLDLKVKCLKVGADDFLAKPYDYRELVARASAIVRRFSHRAPSEIQIGKLAINLNARVASVADVPLRLTRKEYSVLELLSMRRGVVVTKEAFLDHLYRGTFEPGMKIIDVFICRLRRKIADATGGRHYIETVHGRGYVMRDQSPRAAAANADCGTRSGGSVSAAHAASTAVTTPL